MGVPQVLHVADADAFARFGRMFRQLGIALSDEGVRISLLTDDPEAAAELDGTPVEDYLFQPLSGWGSWRLRRFVRERITPQPDIIHSWGTAALSYLSDWSLRLGTPLFIHAISHDDIELLKRRGLRSNERVMAGCRTYCDLFCERWPTLADSFETVTPGLLVPGKAPGIEVRGKTLGLAWSGVIGAGCGLEVLIEAVASLRAKNVDLQVAMLGDGPEMPSVWQEIRRREVQDCFSFIDDPGLWDRALIGADIYVVPSPQRALSLAPLLAMALGKVVIAARGQDAEWFIEDETALQFSPGSAVELAYHISRTAAAHPNVLALARAGAEYVREHHAITKLAAKLAQIYHAVGKGDGRRRAATRGA